MRPQPRPRSPLAGGILLALGPIAGAAIGEAYRQPTLGFLIGLGAAVLAAVALWLADRRSS